MKTQLILLLALATMTFAADQPMFKRPKNQDPALKQTFEAVCNCCGTTNQVKPTYVQCTGSHAVPGGCMVSKTLTFNCPKKGCKEKFTQQAEDEFVPTRPKAILVKSKLTPVPNGPSLADKGHDIVDVAKVEIPPNEPNPVDKGPENKPNE